MGDIEDARDGADEYVIPSDGAGSESTPLPLGAGEARLGPGSEFGIGQRRGLVIRLIDTPVIRFRRG